MELYCPVCDKEYPWKPTLCFAPKVPKTACTR